jgi:hypothetical protein
MNRKIVTLLFAIIVLVIAKPALALDWKDLLPPSEQAKQRDAKMFTVGLPVSDPYNMPGHWQIRPTERLGLGVSFDSQTLDEEPKIGVDRELIAKLSTATAYFQIHPLKNSGFYFGAGAEMRTGTYRIMRPETGAAFWSDATVEESAGEFSAIYAGPTFGWMWLWDNGVTFGFDISKRKRFTDDVEVTKRENAAATYESEIKEQLIPESVSGIVMLGYSF